MPGGPSRAARSRHGGGVRAAGRRQAPSPRGAAGRPGPGMEVEKMDENEWKYHGEGNQSLVVSHCQVRPLRGGAGAPLPRRRAPREGREGGGGPGPPQVRGRAGPFLNRGSGGSLGTAGGDALAVTRLSCRDMGATEGSPGRDRAPLGARGVWRPRGEGGVPPAPCLRAHFFGLSSPFSRVKKETEPGPFAGSIVRRSGGCPRRCCHLTAPGSAPSGPRRSWGRAWRVSGAAPGPQSSATESESCHGVPQNALGIAWI